MQHGDFRSDDWMFPRIRQCSQIVRDVKGRRIMVDRRSKGCGPPALLGGSIDFVTAPGRLADLSLIGVGHSGGAGAGAVDVVVVVVVAAAGVGVGAGTGACSAEG